MTALVTNPSTPLPLFISLIKLLLHLLLVIYVTFEIELGVVYVLHVSAD